MQTEPNNVILFPKWKKTLEEESLYALQEKRYEEALQKLDKLLSYQVDNYEILIAKLMCLMELSRYEEAQALCEELIQHKDDNYYHYLHMYLTILFQTNQYELLMEHAKAELANKQLPEIFREQFTQLYDISKKMNIDIRLEKSILLQEELEEAVEADNHQEQRRIIGNLRRIHAGTTEDILKLLVNERVHPVNKTAIINLLMDNHVKKSVAVQKFDIDIQIIPDELEEMDDNNVYQQILFSLKDIEHKNPTLFTVIEQLLHHYFYVLYPITPPSNDIHHIVNALLQIGQEYLNIHMETTEAQTGSEVHYVDEIKMCEALYLSIIEE